MTKIVHLDDLKRTKRNKLELPEAIELINQQLLDWLSSDTYDELGDCEYEPPAFTLLSGYRRLVTICKAVLEADERGQGLPFQEAMNAMAKEIQFKGR